MTGENVATPAAASRMSSVVITCEIEKIDQDKRIQNAMLAEAAR